MLNTKKIAILTTLATAVVAAPSFAKEVVSIAQKGIEVTTYELTRQDFEIHSQDANFILIRTPASPKTVYLSVFAQGFDPQKATLDFTQAAGLGDPSVSTAREAFYLYRTQGQYYLAPFGGKQFSSITRQVEIDANGNP